MYLFTYVCITMFTCVRECSSVYDVLKLNFWIFSDTLPTIIVKQCLTVVHIYLSTFIHLDL